MRKHILVYCYKCHETVLVAPGEKCSICYCKVEVDWKERKDRELAVKAVQKANTVLRGNARFLKIKNREAANI